LSSNRPDVISWILDRAWTGFRPVQAIKNDARHRHHPIMMYTSQEGELYLGQARALGAVGVLPKQIKPTDVSRCCTSCTWSRPSHCGASSFTPLRMEGVPAGARRRRAVQATHRQRAAGAFRGAAPRAGRRHRHQTDRITGEVRALLLEALPPPPETGAPPPRAATPLWAWWSRARRSPWLW